MRGMIIMIRASVFRCRKNRRNQHLWPALTSIEIGLWSMTIKFIFRTSGPVSREIGRSHERTVYDQKAFWPSCFSSLCLARRDGYYPSLQDEGHEVRSIFLASASPSSSSSSSPPSFHILLFFLLLFFLLLLSLFLTFRSHSIARQKRRTLEVVKKFRSQSHDPFSQSCGCWRTDEEKEEEAVKRTRVNERGEEYTGIGHGTLSANTTIVLHRTSHFDEPSDMHTKLF